MGTTYVFTDADAERFWSQVDIQGPDDCWRWTGDMGCYGWGHFRAVGPGGGWRSMDLAYALKVGEMPENSMVVQTCGNRSCTNPAHLWLKVSLDNQDVEENVQVLRENLKHREALT